MLEPSAGWGGTRGKITDLETLYGNKQLPLKLSHGYSFPNLPYLLI